MGPAPPSFVAFSAPWNVPAPQRFVTPAKISHSERLYSGNSWRNSLRHNHGTWSAKARKRQGAVEIAEEDTMLWTIFVLLMILWVLGMVTAHTMGGFIHLLLLFAIVTVLIRVIQGRRPV